MINLLATRSQLQNQNLIHYFSNNQEINIINKPFIEIEPIINNPKNKAVIKILTKFKKIIFISSNAAHCFKSILQQHKILLSSNTEIFSIGPTTSKVLSSFCSQPVLIPSDNFDSKSLLKHQSLKVVNNEDILVVRGEGGKELIKDQLERRGAKIFYMECYRRKLLDMDVNNIYKLSMKDNLFILITSTEIAKHFLKHVNKDFSYGSYSKKINFIVNHENIKKILLPLKSKIIEVATLQPEEIEKIIFI